MIKYSLRCDKDHVFEAWFSDSSSFEKQNKKNLISCLTCSSTKIEKDIMAPSISSGRQKTDGLKQKKDKVEMILNKVRKHVENNFDYVGDKFTDEAKKIKYGEVKDRPIYGEATIEQTKELIDEEIKVTTLPFHSTKKNN